MRSVVNDENDFMSTLLAGLDEGFFDSPTSTPSSSMQRLPRASLQSSRVLTPASVQPSQSSSIPGGSTAKRVQRMSTDSSPSKKKARRVSSGSRFELDTQLRPTNAACNTCHVTAKELVTTPERKRHGTRPLTTKQEKAKTQVTAELTLTDDDAWLLADLDPFSPSPKKAKQSPPKMRSPTASKPSIAHTNGGIRGSMLTSCRYVRCRVEEVKQSSYIPERYLNAPAGYHTTKGVKPDTVKSAMNRSQIVLQLVQLGRKGEQGEEGTLTKRIAYLRDDWVHTHVRSGDIIHLIGSWDMTAPSRRTPRHIDIELEDEHILDPSRSPLLPSSTFRAPSMTLSSDTQPRLRNGSCEADNLLILHPDLLLSATAISAVVTCVRKPLLQAKIKPSGPGQDDKPSEALVMGRMLHEVLQSCLTGEAKEQHLSDDGVDVDSSARQRRSMSFSAPSTFPEVWTGPATTNFSNAFVQQRIAAQVSRSLDDLLQVGLDTKTACERLWEATLPFGSFASIYLNCPHGTQASEGNVNMQAEALDSRSAVPPLVRVKQVHDVEEDIWSPMYGLKGFVDVSVEVELIERASAGALRPGAIPCARTTTVMMPLELKTGRSISMIEHRAQTMLYALMMSDRYRRPIECGLLYYSKSAELHLVRTARNEVRGLIVSRNELASYLARKQTRDMLDTTELQRSELPPTIDDQRTCSRCYAVDTCMLYRKAVDAVEDGVGDGDKASESPIAGLYDSHTSHLSSKHLSFFRHWENLLSLEEANVVHLRREMWSMTARAREQAGRCYADMVLTAYPPNMIAEHSVRTTGMNHCSIYRFKRAKQDGDAILLGGNFSVGDAICVSIEPAMLSIAQGFLLELTPKHITVGVDRRLEPILIRAGEMQPVFRIDKEEQVSGMAKTRYNLAKLFFAPPAGDARRRELIVDLRAPRFGEPGVTDERLNKLLVGLNADQIVALRTVLSAEDYTLIVGMPGTGKTTTIARLIALLARQGKSVLLASYTHSAVDTICRKLLGVDGVDLLRLGSSDRVHKDVQGNMLTSSDSVEQLQARLLGPNVVATTCLSISHTLFALRPTFDYCIIDEASQITLPTCIGPLRYAHKFVLVGDPQQLPPLVRDPRARQGGLDISLFERLERAHPQAVVHLCHQYRMNEDIMALSNALIYNGRLRCGDATVEQGELIVPRMAAALSRMHKVNGTLHACMQSPHPSMAPCWIERALNPGTRALFISTDDVPLLEERTGELVENGGEARLVLQLCTALVLGGTPAEEIAVLTPYRQQIRRLTHFLHHTTVTQQTPDLTPIEVLTADKSQGRDKDVVIVSFVRSQPANDCVGGVNGAEQYAGRGVGQLLHDVRRINVSLTRARKKLILLGNRRTLSHVPLLARLWTLMEQRGWTESLSGEQFERHWMPAQEAGLADMPSSALS